MNIHEFKRCTRCGNSETFLSCTCKPFKINHQNGEYNAYGVDFDSAAENWAKEFDSDDHPILNKGSVNIIVTDENGESKKFECSAEVDINYFVSEVD